MFGEIQEVKSGGDGDVVGFSGRITWTIRFGEIQEVKSGGEGDVMGFSDRIT